jgi:hypothetical protein
MQLGFNSPRTHTKPQHRGQTSPSSLVGVHLGSDMNSNDGYSATVHNRDLGHAGAAEGPVNSRPGRAPGRVAGSLPDTSALLRWSPIRPLCKVCIQAAVEPHGQPERIALAHRGVTGQIPDDVSGRGALESARWMRSQQTTGALPHQNPGERGVELGRHVSALACVAEDHRAEAQRALLQPIAEVAGH